MATPKQQDDLVRGQAAVWGCIFGYIDTMSLRCAVKLRIPDIVTSHGRPISLKELRDAINIPSLDTDRLSRVLTILVRRGIFSATPSDSGTLYGPTAASELLLVNTEKKSLAAKAMYHSSEFISSLWQHLDDCVKDGSSAFTKRFGMDAWSYMSANPDMYELMQQSLAGTSKFAVEALKIGYLQKGLKGVGSLVDVGGGSGALVGEIVKEFPHIKGTNLDLPTVVAFASEHPGVTHVAGNMLVSVPPADAVLIKQVLHDWNDEDTIKILTNCRKAIPKKTGKVIILEMILDPYGNDPMDDTIVGYDLFMLVGHGTKERTEAEWKTLLEAAGFSRYNVIKLPSFLSVIETYPAN